MYVCMYSVYVCMYNVYTYLFFVCTVAVDLYCSFIIFPSPQFLVGCVHWLFPDFTFQWLVEEIRTNLPVELDFSHEAHNQERFTIMFSHLK